MIEERCNIWDKHERGEWVCITTNGFLKKDGSAVMGRGVAQQAAGRHPVLPFWLGQQIRDHGNQVHVHAGKRMVFFPVKHKWYEKADLDLIATSAKQLESFMEVYDISKIYLPRPGCGNGQLTWEEVKPVIEFLDDSVVVVKFP